MAAITWVSLGVALPGRLELIEVKVELIEDKAAPVAVDTVVLALNEVTFVLLVEFEFAAASASAAAAALRLAAMVLGLNFIAAIALIHFTDRTRLARPAGATRRGHATD